MSFSACCAAFSEPHSCFSLGGIGIGDKAGERYRPGGGLLRVLGPGLITGASDDDPSGIATYSQAGAQFGYGMLGRCCSPIR